MIELTEVSKTYPDGTIAVHPTSLRIGRGELTVLLGRSGAGKSTLLRCLNSLVTPSTGAVLVDGQEISGSTRRLRAHRRGTAMIFQQHQLIGRHSALRNVLCGRLGHHRPLRTLLPLPSADQHLALECLTRVGLLSKALSRVDELSGGEQQRVGIARALAQQPVLVLADEPVASLDPETSEEVLVDLRDVCRADGLTAIVSLHQVELAARFADRVIGMAYGRVVFDGPPQELDATARASIYRGVDQPSHPVDAEAAEPAGAPDLLPNGKVLL
ncbi:MAG: phosphonate ABC transporter ATP-binding protein [Solirubrobacteraceae bacterium]